MKSDKYMGMDIHQAMTVVAVLDAREVAVASHFVPLHNSLVSTLR